MPRPTTRVHCPRTSGEGYAAARAGACPVPTITEAGGERQPDRGDDTLDASSQID